MITHDSRADCQWQSGTEVVEETGWWRWEESNLRQRAYETPALPLSYTAKPSKLYIIRPGDSTAEPRTCPKTCP